VSLLAVLACLCVSLQPVSECTLFFSTNWQFAFLLRLTCVKMWPLFSSLMPQTHQWEQMHTPCLYMYRISRIANPLFANQSSPAFWSSAWARLSCPNSFLQRSWKTSHIWSLKDCLTRSAIWEKDLIGVAAAPFLPIGAENASTAGAAPRPGWVVWFKAYDARGKMVISPKPVTAGRHNQFSGLCVIDCFEPREPSNTK
jgi:hypothetical protein